MQQIRQIWQSFLLQRSLLGLIGASLTLLNPAAFAAERVVLRYGSLTTDVTVSDLKILGDTGQAPASIESYLRMANRQPADVQRALISEVKISHVLLDRVLNNPIGEAALDRLGEVIQTPTGGANRQALRAALILSASDDGKLSLLEILQKYPTQEVYLDGKRLLTAYRELKQLEKQAQKIEDLIKIFNQ